MRTQRAYRGGRPRQQGSAEDPLVTVNLQVRQQKQQDKAARRLAAKQRRPDAASGIGETTLEMADRRLGPQPLPAPGDGVGDHE